MAQPHAEKPKAPKDDKVGDKVDDKSRSSDPLAHCADLSRSENRVPTAPGLQSRETCKLPPVTIESEKNSLDNIAKELRKTALFDMKTWVTPEHVLSAMRAAHFTDFHRFENEYKQFENADLREELHTKLTTPDDYRTAISILENRESEKQTADKLTIALDRNIMHLKLGADTAETLNILESIKPEDRARFEQDFPKNEGEELQLRAELHDKLGDSDEYRASTAALDNREGEKQSADKVRTALEQTSWWGIQSNPDAATVLETIGGMTPAQRAQFEQNYPKNEGDGQNLREQLKKYLSGDPDQYKLIIQFLDEKPPVAKAGDPKAPATDPDKVKQIASIGEWVDDFKKLNSTLGIKGLVDIDPLNVNEKEFKEKYAREVTQIGQQFGLTKEQTKNIAQSLYALELGGWGTSYTTAGMPPRLLADGKDDERLGFHPISSAVGYNQLLKSTTLDVVKDHGVEIAERLKEMGREQPGGSLRAQELQAKAQLLTILNADVKDPTKVDSRLTTKEFGNAVQALNIDGDVGPLLQSQGIRDLLTWFTRKKDSLGKKSVAELLTETAARLNAPGEVFDKLKHVNKTDAATKAVQLAKPSKEDEPIVRDLIKKLTSMPAGLTARLDLSQQQQQVIDDAQNHIGRLSPKAPARALLQKVHILQRGVMTPGQLAPAALEMANLAGQGSADSMLLHPYVSTKKHFTSEALAVNKIARGKDGQGLLLDIYSTMQTNLQQQYPGTTEFQKAFDNATVSKKK